MNLWYKQPAEKWVEALPVGNGHIGGMVFGKPDAEIIAINEDTLWSGYPRDLNPRNKAPVYQKIQALALNKQFHEAQALFEDELCSGWTESYLPLGDLLLRFNHNAVTEYKRELDLETAVAETRYHCDGIHYRREVFVSAPDDIMVIRLSADTGKRISLELGVRSQLRTVSRITDACLCLEGIAPSHAEPSYSHELEEPVSYSDRDEEKGMRFVMMVRPVVSGGTLSCGEDTITIANADSVLLLVSAQTSFAGYDVQPWLHGKNEKRLCVAAIEKAAHKNYEALLKRHTEDYQSYYHRVSLSLGENENTRLPTDERLRRFSGEHADPALYTLLFQYGRYLLISSSRPGTQAANLQGIWNSELRAPWSSNFTININTQMNYWPVFSCALGELQQPLTELIRALSVKGKDTARELYGAEGFTSHHNADIWAVTWPVGNHHRGTGTYAAWNLSAAWLCRHLFDAWEYTQDRQFLADTAYPIMKEAARFLIALLVEDEQGRLMFCPSTSPENSFVWEGKSGGMARTATMTMAIVRELFANCITACTILNRDEAFAETLSRLAEKLVPFQIGSKGQLLEWDDEYEEAEVRHRHSSHLYGLYPGNQISRERTPELAAACKKSLEFRGDDGTGWSLAWKVNLWARLQDGNHALTILNNQLRFVDESETNYSGGGGTYTNMFDAHPPFQIDGNFGVTAGIAEMLLQNTDDGIHLLPALPDSWKRGFCKGLCAKKQITVDISWNEGTDGTTASFLSPVDQRIQLYHRGIKVEALELAAGKRVSIRI
ncbi:alpha/beta hydrolase [Spirochaetia bacterium]|nr:alpha/beta hydrolase [Spirochaetia bacterium]